MRDRLHQAAEKNIHCGNAMPNPDVKWHGLCTKAGFGFQRRTAERDLAATHLNSILNDGLKQTEVNGKLAVRMAVESDVVTNSRIAVPQGRDEAENFLLLPNHGASK